MDKYSIGMTSVNARQLVFIIPYMKEGDRYRLWYRGGGVWDGIRADRRPEPCTCYAESGDGIHWGRPVLGIHETRGSGGSSRPETTTS